MNINVGTFNILDPNFAVKYQQAEGLTSQGKSNWATRKDVVINTIKDSNLDVICLQEISKTSFDDIKEALKNAGYMLKHIPHSGRSDGLAILYKKDKFEEKKFKPITKYGISSCYVDLKEVATGTTIRVANCHLLGGPQQDKGKEQIEKLVQEVDQPFSEQIDVAIIMGDFNASENQLNVAGTKLEVLKKANYQFDGNLSPTESGKNRHIDWIWVRSSSALLTPLQTESRALGHAILQKQAASDHKLLGTQIKFQATSSTSSPSLSVSPFKHAQPLGSFRAKIMHNFSVTGWDAALRADWASRLDKILIKQANVTPFLPAVYQEFQKFVNTLYMSNENKEMLMNDLEKAIQAAQQKPTVTKAQPHRASTFATKKAKVSKPPISPIFPPKRPAISPVFPKSNPRTFFQWIRSAFSEIFDTVARWFGF